MKIIKPLLITTSILLSQASFANNKHEAGEKLFQTNCAVCHGAAVGGMDISKRIAPPIAAVRMHYIDTYPDEASFIQAVSNWVGKQDESKSLMRGAIQKFKIMPPLAISKEDAVKIAAYIYDGNIEKPEGFEQHVKDEHGGKDMEKMHSKGMHEQAGGMHNMEGMHNKVKGQHQGKGMGMHQMMQGQQRMMQMLNLSPLQQQQMQSLFQEKQSKIEPVKKELHQINNAIRQLDTTSPDYKSQIFSLADEKAKRVHRMVIERGEIRMKIESVLNVEQRAKFKQLKQQRRQQMQNH